MTEVGNSVELRISASKNCGVGNWRKRRLRKCFLKYHALSSDCIQVGSESALTAQEAHAVGPRGINGYENDIRGFRPSRRTNQEPEKKCLNETQHEETKREFTRGKLPRRSVIRP